MNIVIVGIGFIYTCIGEKYRYCCDAALIKCDYEWVGSY